RSRRPFGQMRTGEAHRVAQLCDIAETGVLGRPEEVPLMQMHVVENLVVVVDRGGRDADAIHLFDNFGDGVIAQSVLAAGVERVALRAAQGGCGMFRLVLERGELEGRAEPGPGRRRVRADGDVAVTNFYGLLRSLCLMRGPGRAAHSS